MNYRGILQPAIRTVIMNQHKRAPEEARWFFDLINTHTLKACALRMY